MELGAKSVTGVSLALVALVAGAYWLGSQQGGPSAPDRTTAEQDEAPVSSPSQSPAASVLPRSVQSTQPAAPASAHTEEDAKDQQGRAGVQAADPHARFTHFNVGNSNVKSMFLQQDYIWVGTSNGVIRYHPASDQYRLFDNRSGLLSNGIFWVGEINDQIAVGTYGGGLSVLDADSEVWRNYNIPQGLGDAFVYGALEASNGDLWIATWSGANRIKQGRLDDSDSWETFTVENTSGGLPNDWVYGLAEGKNGEIWLATEGGLARFNQGQWQNWNHQNGLGAPMEAVKDDPQFGNDPAAVSKHHASQKQEMGLHDVDVAYNPNYIISITVDDSGAVWCGTWGGGLARFDGQGWQNYTMADGLPGNHIFMLHYDHNGVLWVGTNNGLAKRQGDEFISYTTAEGLFSNSVFSMVSAADQTRWVGSFGGVARIKGL